MTARNQFAARFAHRSVNPVEVPGEKMAADERRRAVTLVTILVIGASLWGASAWWDWRTYHRAIADATTEIKAGRTGHAAKQLEALLSWKPYSDEAKYLLGTCEKARGNARAASEAWARVTADSSFSAGAMQGRIELAVDTGRFADAEKLVKYAATLPRLDPFLPPHSFLMALCQQGRSFEAERLVEAGWDQLDGSGLGASERAIALVRLHVFIRLVPMPVDAIRTFVDRAARLAPDDDRVWLARANLDIQTGQLDAALRLLENCLRRRPDDAPVWRTRLAWAMASNDIVAVRQAAKHLKLQEMRPGQADALAAWIAGRQGDLKAEREALERALAAVPDDFTVLSRLADLAAQNGEPDRAAELKRRQTEVQAMLDRYRKLDERNQPIRDAPELAHLAVTLGQRFEARAYLTLAAVANPDRDDLRRDLARLSALPASVLPAIIELPGRED